MLEWKKKKAKNKKNSPSGVTVNSTDTITKESKWSWQRRDLQHRKRAEKLEYLSAKKKLEV